MWKPLPAILPSKERKPVQDWLVRLRFTGPAHFGEAGIGQETANVTLRSDSLYSAIWSVWARYGLEPGLSHLLDVSPFRVSSAFLFDGSTHYLPRPSLPVTGLEQRGKLIKQTRYLPLPLFRAWAGGAPVDADALEKANDRYEHLSRFTLRPRVALDRVSQRSVLYQVAQVTFAEGAGLWFLVRLGATEWLAPLQQAIEVLGQDGLGGRRSAGYGSFVPEWVDVTADPEWQALLGDGSEQGPHCLLSLCNPAPEELPALLDGAAYEVIERQGWAASGRAVQAPRLPVRMLTEGSVLAARPRGRVLNVSPPGFAEAAGHPVLRSGLALAVPVGRGETL